MEAHAYKGFASRIGFGLGTFVCFCLHDRRPVVRWIKRACLVVVLFVILVQNFTWLASAFMTLLSFGLIGWVLVKGDFRSSNSWKKMKPKQLHMAEMFSVMSWIGWGDEMMEFFLVKTSKKGAF
ncbi:hypothetical protein [Pseudomonas aeruginosa]|uniref:hypothetical protein n=1 Tax=Pseudomonas aeruginosa TaxID=287 RepID=UPI001F08B892|nr:hypothetical protein [Pseudomonas aeruginosa]